MVIKRQPFVSSCPPSSQVSDKAPKCTSPAHTIPKTELSRSKPKFYLETWPPSAPSPQAFTAAHRRGWQKGERSNSRVPPRATGPRTRPLACCHCHARPGKLPGPHSLGGHLLVRCCQKTNSQCNSLPVLAEAAHDPAMPFLCQLGTPCLGRIPSTERSRYFSPIYTPSAAENITKDSYKNLCDNSCWSRLSAHKIDGCKYLFYSRSAQYML